VLRVSPEETWAQGEETCAQGEPRPKTWAHGEEVWAHHEGIIETTKENPHKGRGGASAPPADAGALPLDLDSDAPNGPLSVASSLPPAATAHVNGNGPAPATGRKSRRVAQSTGKPKPSPFDDPTSDVSQAVDAYNELAMAHGFTQFTTKTLDRGWQVNAALVRIGGLSDFRLALSAIPSQKWMLNMGGKFNLGFLVAVRKSDGRDHLAELLDHARTATAQAKPSNGLSRIPPVDLASITPIGWRQMADGLRAGEEWPRKYGAPPWEPGSHAREILAHPNIVKLRATKRST
jgi:hypothetical protein